MNKGKKVSYIRKPFARRSFLCLGLAVGALILGSLGLISSVMSAGDAPLNVAAVCFSSMVVCAVSLGYGMLSFLEKERKYILSKVGVGISGLLLLFWLVLIIIGLKG